MAKTVSELQKVLGQAAKDDPSRRFHSLYDKVYRTNVLWEALHRVIKKGGSGGVDGKEIDDYTLPEIQEDFIREIQRELREENYKPKPVKRIYIPKADGGERPLGIPTIKDRVVQTAAKLILEPIFEADFKEYSYGFRGGKSSHQALQAVWKWLNFGHTEVLDADVSKFFDTIPHDKLLRTIAKRVSDGKMLRLIKLFLKAPIQDGDRLHKSKQGTPQGGVISPLLANIYLHHLDEFWEKKGYQKYAKLVRYADDWIICCQRNVEAYFKEAKRLMENIGLNLSIEKTKVVKVKEEGFNFLGFQFRRVWVYRPKYKDYGWVTGVGISEKVLKKARKTVNEIVGQGGRKSPIPMQDLVDRVNEWIVHWLPYYCYANRKEDFKKVYHTIVLRRLTLSEVARRTGNKRCSRKWKSWNPKYWEKRYGLIDMVEQYYMKRKQLYARLFEHPRNAMA